MKVWVPRYFNSQGTREYSRLSVMLKRLTKRNTRHKGRVRKLDRVLVLAILDT